MISSETREETAHPSTNLYMARGRLIGCALSDNDAGVCSDLYALKTYFT